MADFQNGVAAMRRIEAELEAQLQSVRAAIAALVGSGTGGRRRGRPPGSGKRGPGRPKGSGKKRKGMSAAGRAKISEAQKARWARQKAEKK